MNDEPTIARQWRMLRTLGARRHGIVVRDLAREFGVSEKTIRRNLQELQRVGFPIHETTGERGRKIWRLADHAVVPPLCFNYDEAIVLHLARPFLEPLAGTVLWEAAHRALDKIKATLNETAREYLEQFPRVFGCTTHGNSNYENKAEIIDTLTVAAEDRNVVLLTYQSQHATEPATRDIYPYGLKRHKGSLYLVAFAVEHEEIRHYKVNRVEAAELTPFVFQKPADFDISTYLAESFGIFGGSDDITVVVKVLPAAARYASESVWHASQVLTKQRDGSLMVHFRLSSTVEIKSWVLSFGANAVVLEPASFRAEMAAELEQMARFYATPVPPPAGEPATDGQPAPHRRASLDHAKQTQEPPR
jgi:predicted DNA-binding transcriptional regulator YafY